MKYQDVASSKATPSTSTFATKEMTKKDIARTAAIAHEPNAKKHWTMSMLFGR